MARHDLRLRISRDTWAADDEGDVEIFLEGALLAGLQPVLADVVAVIGTVHDVGVVENAG